MVLGILGCAVGDQTGKPRPAERARVPSNIEANRVWRYWNEDQASSTFLGVKHLVIPDCNGDGWPDIAVTSRGNWPWVARGESLICILSGGDGELLKRIILRPGLPACHVAMSLANSESVGVVLVVMDMEGPPDLDVLHIGPEGPLPERADNLAEVVVIALGSMEVILRDRMADGATYWAHPRNNMKDGVLSEEGLKRLQLQAFGEGLDAGDNLGDLDGDGMDDCLDSITTGDRIHVELSAPRSDQVWIDPDKYDRGSWEYILGRKVIWRGAEHRVILFLPLSQEERGCVDGWTVVHRDEGP
jgi:hypothetical protein